LTEFVREVTVVKLLPTIDTLEQALRNLPEHSDHSGANSDNSGRNLKRNTRIGKRALTEYWYN
jgi:molecular chaperone GrpE (heat shock protein)